MRRQFILIFTFISILIAAPQAGRHAAHAQHAPQVAIYFVSLDNVTDDPVRGFVTTKSAHATWTVQVVITNPVTNPATFQDLVWSNAYDNSLKFGGANASRGVVDPALFPAPQIDWAIDSLAPGETAVLVFQLSTHTPGDREPPGTPLGCRAWESGAVLSYRLAGDPTNLSVDFEARQWCVDEDPPWITFSFTPAKMWRVRAPGCFASEAVRIEVASNSSVSVTFDEFADLTSADGQGYPPIPTWYSRGGDLSQAVWNGWIAAADFNGTKWTFTKSAQLESGVAETIWNRICVGPEHPAAEYEDEGAITLVLRGVETHVDP